MGVLIVFLIIIIGFGIFHPVMATIFGVLACITIVTYVIIDKNKKKKEKLKQEEMKRIQQQREQERLENIRQEREKRELLWAEQQRKREVVVNGWRNNFKIEVDSLPLFEISLSNEKHNRNSSINASELCKNITKATPISKIKNFVAVDVETTGLKASGNDIIQLSAIKFKDFSAVEKFNTYIKPRKSIPLEATNINKITDEMVNDAPKFYQVIDSFNTFIEDLPLVAHNAPFDMNHLYVNGLDSIANKIAYDALSLSKRIMKDEYSYKLKDICESANIYMTGMHNSVYDSYATGKLFIYLIAERREISVESLLNMVM